MVQFYYYGIFVDIRLMFVWLLYPEPCLDLTCSKGENSLNSVMFDIKRPSKSLDKLDDLGLCESSFVDGVHSSSFFRQDLQPDIALGGSGTADPIRFPMESRLVADRCLPRVSIFAFDMITFMFLCVLKVSLILRTFLPA